MTYGHADGLARSTGPGPASNDGQPPGTDPQPSEQHPLADRPPETMKADTPGDLAPDWYAAPELAPVLAGRHIGALYRWLNNAGVPQRRIAALTGTSQPQVADIITGRRARVMVYDVLVRTAEGLSIPRERMGLSFWGPDGKWYGPPGTYPGRVITSANTPKVVTAAMLRRHLIAWGGIIMAGVPVAKVGERLDDLGELPPVSQPSRLSPAHVAQVANTTRSLRDLSRAHGSNPELSSAAANQATRLLDLPGTEPVKRALMVAAAQQRLQAGWAAFDAGLYHHALHHYALALELATKAGDAYCQALALTYAGLASTEHGHPDDGLKMLQFGQLTARNIPSDEERPVAVGVSTRAAVAACALADSALSLIHLGCQESAYRELAKGRDLWLPSRTDPSGDLDLRAAQIELDQGRLDIAERFATASVRRWEGSLNQRSRTGSGIVLATIHVRAGEQDGLRLAHGAIADVTKLTSVRARRRLLPLIAALEARPGSDARELARTARQVTA